MRAWAIKAWNETYENAASRKLRRLDYFPFPTDRGSLRFKTLLQTPEGGLAYGHFAAIVQYAAALPCRGLLVRSGRALTPTLLAVDMGIPEPVLAPSWAILAAPDCGWLYETEVSDPAHLPTCWPSPAHPPAIRHERAADPPTKASRQETCQENPVPGFSLKGRGRAEDLSGGNLACLPGEELRAWLWGIGVRDPVLAELVESGRVDKAYAVAAWEQVQEGTRRTRNPVVDPVGALTTTLARRAGIRLRAPSHIANADDRRRNEALMKLREQRRTGT